MIMSSARLNIRPCCHAALLCAHCSYSLVNKVRWCQLTLMVSLGWDKTFSTPVIKNYCTPRPFLRSPPSPPPPLTKNIHLFNKRSRLLLTEMTPIDEMTRCESSCCTSWHSCRLLWPSQQLTNVSFHSITEWDSDFRWRKTNHLPPVLLLPLLDLNQGTNDHIFSSYLFRRTHRVLYNVISLLYLPSKPWWTPPQKKVINVYWKINRNVIYLLKLTLNNENKQWLDLFIYII